MNHKEERKEDIRILTNSLFILISRGIFIFTRFFVFVWIARYLEIEPFGRYGFVAVFASILMSLSYFGIQQVLVRAIAREKDKAPVYLGIALLLRTSLSVIASLVIIGSAFFMSLSHKVMMAMVIATLSEVLLSFGAVVRAVFQAYERMKYEPLISLLQALVMITGVGGVIISDKGFIALFLAIAFSNLIPLLIASYLVWSKFTRPVLALQPSLIMTFLKDSLIVGLGIILLTNLLRVNVLLLNWLKGTKDVAFFHSVNGLIMRMNVLPVSLMVGFFPALSRMASDNRERLEKVYGSMIKYIFIVALFLGIYLHAFSDEIVQLLFRGKYLPAAPALRILSMSVVFLFLDMAIIHILIAIDRHKDTVVITGLTMMANFFIALILIPKHGFIGAAYTSLLSCFILCLLCFYTMKMNRFSLSWLDTGGKAAAAGLITLLSIMFIKPISPWIAAPVGVAVYLLMLVLTQSLPVKRLALS